MKGYSIRVHVRLKKVFTPFARVPFELISASSSRPRPKGNPTCEVGTAVVTNRLRLYSSPPK
jgi:hypothetical protein